MKTFLSLGLMSGTSMDGIDISLIKTDGNIYELLNYNLFVKYSRSTLNLLSKTILLDFNLINPISLKKIEEMITLDHVKAVKKFIKKFDIIPDIIGFHGQTVYHNYERKISVQLGDGNLLAKLTGIKVVYNFRRNDILNGGHGAPISPIYHQAIMQKTFTEYPCSFVNIGGVSNITWWDKKQLIGFDIGPGNGLIDIFVQKFYKKAYDFEGKLAYEGNIDFETVEIVLNDVFFKKKFPKSLDRLSFKYIFDDINFKKLSLVDSVSTLSQITIMSIVKSIKLLPKPPQVLCITGGGRHNLYIYNSLKKKLNESNIKVIDLENDIDMIEAELMAYLAVRHINNLPITFPETTGVKLPLVGGELSNTK